MGLDNLDGVIRIIRESSSNAVASAGLRKGKLSMYLYFILKLEKSGFKNEF